MSDEARPEAEDARAEPTTETRSDLFDFLHAKVHAKSAQAKSDVQQAIETLASSLLQNQIKHDTNLDKMLKEAIAEIDGKLEKQVNRILHHDEFQKLESAWRGLEYLVKNTETDEQLQVKFINIPKKELANTLADYKGTEFDQSPIFKKVYEENLGVLGGDPIACLVGDYYFDHSAEDVETLGEMSKIAAAAHAPFLGAVSPSLLKMDSWQELPNPSSLAKLFRTPDYAPWKSLRETEDAKYIGLAMPRFLARYPWGAKGEVEEFRFNEQVEGGDHSGYCWANSAFAMAANITRSFKEYGWCARIRGVESGGRRDDLPVHTFPTDDGGMDMKCPTEVSITDRRENELGECGFMPLIHVKGTDKAAFIGAQSLQQPFEYNDPDATANAKLGARLPYMFAACRFNHYLTSMVRNKIGGFTSESALKTWLQDWINQYVLENPENQPEIRLAQKPLQAAEVEVSENPENPGYYDAVFRVKPHYQLEGLTMSLRLVSKLKSEKAS